MRPRRFKKGEIVRYDQIKGFVHGGDGRHTDGAQPYRHLGDDIYEPILPELEHNRIYRFAEVADRMSLRGVDPDTKFRYCKTGAHGYFEEVVEPSPHSLVPAEEVASAIRRMRARGLDAGAIAKAAGISRGAAERALAGGGYLRIATRDALLQAAARNGRRRKR